jgi:hypothetical protein
MIDCFQSESVVSSTTPMEAEERDENASAVRGLSMEYQGR